MEVWSVGPYLPKNGPGESGRGFTQKRALTKVGGWIHAPAGIGRKRSARDFPFGDSKRMFGAYET